MRIVSHSRAAGGRRASLFLPGGPTLLVFCLAAFSFSVSARPRNQQPAENSPDLKAFVGTWKGSFQGKVFAILVLKEHGGKLSGTMNNFDVGVDKEGNLNDDTHADAGDAPLLNVRFKEGALLFLVLEKDQYRGGTQWKFVLKTADEGELTPLLESDPETPKGLIVKPIRMVREHPKP
jgi:hypothetical protein